MLAATKRRSPVGCILHLVEVIQCRMMKRKKLIKAYSLAEVNRIMKLICLQYSSFLSIASCCVSHDRLQRPVCKFGKDWKAVG